MKLTGDDTLNDPLVAAWDGTLNDPLVAAGDDTLIDPLVADTGDIYPLCRLLNMVN